MLEDNPRGAQAIEVSSVFCAIALAVVVLRLYTRLFVVRCPGVEDFFIAFAMACSVGLTVCIGIQAMCGMGQHYDTLQQKDLTRSLKAFYASLIVYNLSLGLIKTSILLQYRRVFTTKRFQIVCWIVLAIVGIYTTWSVLGSVFACLPIQAFWFKDIPAKCINQYAMWFTNASINITTDFIIIILPMPVIKSLNLARRQKQALIGIFAVGGLVCIVSILRLHSLVAISNSTDPTYDNPPAATWSSVETNIGIICSCLPCLRPLMARCFPGIFSSASQSPKTNASSVASFFSRSVVRGKKYGWGPEEERGINEDGGSMKATCGACVDEHGHKVERDGSIVVTTEVRVRVDGRERSTERIDELLEHEMDDEKEKEWDLGMMRRMSSAESMRIVSGKVGV